MFFSYSVWKDFCCRFSGDVQVNLKQEKLYPYIVHHKAQAVTDKLCLYQRKLQPFGIS